MWYTRRCSPIPMRSMCIWGRTARRTSSCAMNARRYSRFFLHQYCVFCLFFRGVGRGGLPLVIRYFNFCQIDPNRANAFRPIGHAAVHFDQYVGLRELFYPIVMLSCWYVLCQTRSLGQSRIKILDFLCHWCGRSDDKLRWKCRGQIFEGLTLMGPFCHLNVKFLLRFTILDCCVCNCTDHILSSEWREAVQTCGNARKGEIKIMVELTRPPWSKVPSVLVWIIIILPCCYRHQQVLARKFTWKEWKVWMVAAGESVLFSMPGNLPLLQTPQQVRFHTLS